MKNLTFLKGEGEGEEGPPGVWGPLPPIHKFLSRLLIIAKHMNMLCSKFNQNHTINEDFDFCEWLGGGAPGG